MASGICHTEVHAAGGDCPVKPPLPFIPGHEGVGEVVKLGPGEHDVNVGDMVGNAWLWSACGTCEFCRTGRETYCPNAEYGGYIVNGSFGEYMLVDTRYCARIPEGSDPIEVAPILCAGVTVYKGLKEANTRPGEYMVISGAGLLRPRQDSPGGQGSAAGGRHDVFDGLLKGGVDGRRVIRY